MFRSFTGQGNKPQEIGRAKGRTGKLKNIFEMPRKQIPETRYDVMHEARAAKCQKLNHPVKAPVAGLMKHNEASQVSCVPVTF